MRPEYVAREQIAEVFPEVRDLTIRALKKGTGADNVDTVFRALLEGRMGLVIFKERDGDIGAFAIVRVVNYDEFDALQVIVVGGENYKAWEQAMDAMLVGWARTNECSRIESYSRPGAAKVMEPLGYRTLCHVMAKEV